MFFQGDTSGLEPYVQTDLGSARERGLPFYRQQRLLRRHDQSYATVTVEGLNEQAVEDLKSSRSDAEFHRELWGDALADNMLEKGISGPDTIVCNRGEVTEAAGYEYTGGSMGGKDLPGTETSRSRTVEVGFDRWLGPVDTPLELWVGFMGREYSVKIPLDTGGGLRPPGDRPGVPVQSHH